MSMTPRELFEIVKDVPRDAWPYQMMFHARRQMFTNEIEPSPRWDLTEEWAELAFIGSMTAWLMNRNVFASKSQVDESYWTIDMNNVSRRSGNYRTLVAALAAACKEAA